jgi:DNA-directed RNA polymerase sigma subunit (sigma70/sigma32)
MQFAYKEREKGRTLKSIGDDLGLSKERIRSMIEYIKREIRQGRIEIAHS